MKVQNPRLKDLFNTPKKKTISFSGITLLLVGISIFFVIRPTFVKISDLNKEIKEKEEFLQKIDSKYKTVNQLIGQKQSVSSELLDFESSFVPKEKSGFLVANLSSIAKKFDINFVSIEFEPKDRESNEEILYDEEVNFLEVTVSVQGELSEIESYIGYLEEFPWLLDIRSVSMEKLSISDSKKNKQNFKPIEARITLYFHYWEDLKPEE